MAFSVKLGGTSKYDFLEKLENLLCFATILFIFIFNFNEEGGRTVTNALIIVFSGVEILLASRKVNRTFCYGLANYGIFVLVCTLSCIYSDARDDSIVKLKTVAILWFFMLSLYIFMQNKNREELIMKFIIYASVAAAIYLIVNSEWKTGERASRIIGDSNQAGAYFAYSATVLLYCIKQKILNFKILAWGGLATIVLAILISGSRSSLVELFIGLVLLQIMLDHAKEVNMIKRIIGFAFIVAAIVFIYHLAMTNKTLYQILGVRIESMFEIFSGKKSSINEMSTFNRAFMRQEAAKRFFQSPVLGKGIGSFAKYISTKLGRAIFAHNNYLELLQGVGLLGTIPYYSFYFTSFKGYFKNRTDIATLTVVIMAQMLFAHYAVVFYYQKLEILFMALIMKIIADNITNSGLKLR